MALVKYGGIALAEVKAMPPDEVIWWTEKLRGVVNLQSDE